ncbi:MAG: hypothetical protein J7500_00625 [Sphingomonas sp.]|uniref:hypothetical protein n=1 Tax=Sphingomonas sp. TaxID=28214 RepID=UPI001B096FE8|nr:hypothetical protein [Sphingomonas sp.]MBO9621192.1 hypothetical protein [Sphingomonas sp.]
MKQLFGGVLIAMGLLVMTCSGLCSLAVVAAVFDEALRDPSTLMLPLLVGGIPFALGFGAFRWGRSLSRKKVPEA